MAFPAREYLYWFRGHTQKIKMWLKTVVSLCSTVQVLLWNRWISISELLRFSRLHLLRSMQAPLAGYWFHLSHCMDLPGTRQEVIVDHLDAAQSLSPFWLLLLSWPLLFPQLFSGRKLSLYEYEGTWPSVRHNTKAHQHSQNRTAMIFPAMFNGSLAAQKKDVFFH